MKWFCIGVSLALLVVLVKYWLYRRQIREICRQLDFLRKEKTNKRIQTDLYQKEIIALADRINRMADRQEEGRISITKKEQRLKETLANISHDIRTPLTSLKGFFELYAQEEDTKKSAYYKQIIEARMEDLSVLLEELFTYTKLQNESYELALAPENFTKLVLDSLFSFYEQWKEKGIHPALSIEESPAMVLCNDVAVKRILTNVLRNAIMHGDGNIEICYHIQNDKILFVCSNGFETQQEVDPDRVFERFYKGDAARRESSSGLGLSIAKELTLRMAGTLEAKLENSLFIVELSFRCI